MYKKITVLCVMAILFGICGTLAANADATDLLAGYGSFENGTAGWSGSWGSNASVETDIVHSGTQSLKITNSVSTDKPWVMRSYTGLTAGATYTVEGYINATFSDGRGAGFKTEVYGEDVSEGNETLITDATNGHWVKLTHTFLVPQGTNKLKLYCRLYTIGTTYFDDVTLCMTAPPTPFSFAARDIFHYADDTEGTATVTLDEYYNPADYADIRVRFKITEGNEIIDTQVLPLTDGAAIYTYNPQLLKLRSPQNTAPQYTLEAEVYTSAENTVIESYTQSLYRYNRPEMLDADGFVRLENGTIFDPVMAYHVTNTENYKYMRDIGVNVVQVPYWYTSRGEAAEREALLAELDKYGLKALFCLYRNMKMPNDSANYANTQYVVNAHKDDDRIFAWAIMDEPLGGGVTEQRLAALEASYKMIRDIDSKHPTYFVDYNSANYAYDVKYCDVFAVDPYIYSLTGVVRCTNTAVRLMEGKKPVYTLVGTFKTQTGLFPAPSLVRHMTYQALVHGAKGFGYFAFEDSIAASLSDTGEKVPLYETNLWEPMCRYAAEDMPLAFANLVHNSAPVIKQDNIAEKQWTEKENEYHFMMSMSDAVATRSYNTTGTGVEVLYGTETENVAFVENESGVSRVDVTIPSGTVMLFRVTGVDSMRNLVSNGDFEGIGGSLFAADDSTKLAYWEVPAACLATDETGNHYFKNTTGAGISLNFVKKAEVSAAKTYKLSFRYKHPTGKVMQVRFNAGNSTYDYSVNAFQSADDDRWQTHVIYLKIPLWSNTNKVRIGGYGGSFLTGEWCIDDICLTPAIGEAVASSVPSGIQEAWQTAQNRGENGVQVGNDMQYKTAVYEPIESLAAANVQPDGTRIIYATFVGADDTLYRRQFAAVYECTEATKRLIDLQSVTVPENSDFSLKQVLCNVPQGDGQTTYQVRLLRWNSAKGLQPQGAAITVSDG